MTNGNNGGNWLTETLANRPFVVGALFLGTYFVPFLVLIGLALAYYFRRSPEEDWEQTHYSYLIRTFWIGFLSAALVFLLSALGLLIWQQIGGNWDGDLVFFSVFFPLVIVMIPLLVFCGVRVVLSLMRSAAHKPMPRPETWLL